MAAETQPPVISRGTKPSSHPLLSQLELIKEEEINKTKNNNKLKYIYIPTQQTKIQGTSQASAKQTCFCSGLGLLES